MRKYSSCRRERATSRCPRSSKENFAANATMEKLPGTRCIAIVVIRKTRMSGGSWRMIKQFAGDPGWSVARLRAWIALCVFFCGTSAGVTSEGAVKVSPDESTPAAAGAAPAAEPLSARVAADAVVEATDTAEYSGEIYKIGLGWHPSALQEFTRDKVGLVNWVATLNDKKINPRSSIDPQAVETPPFDLNIVMP